MKNVPLANCDLQAAEIALGCMRITELSDPEIARLIHTALDEGINFFDHADIYGGGECETRFASAIGMNAALRERMILQSKVGIRQGQFDFSKEYILESVDGCLKRLQTGYLDALLLHRPDALVEPEEVADAFDQLESSGKVRYFGVSNHHPRQIDLLRRYVKPPIIFNQLQFSITNTGMIDAGIYANMQNAPSIDHDGGILDYCRLHDITIQPWSPFLYGFFEGVFLGSPKFPELNAKIDELAAKYSVTNSAIAIAWILRHPAHMQPIVGTTNAGRLKEIAKASDVQLTRKEWYEVYIAAGNKLP